MKNLQYVGEWYAKYETRPQPTFQRIDPFKIVSIWELISM